VGLSNLESGEAFLINGERHYPMAGVAGLPLAAALLSEVDAGRTLLDERLYLLEEQLSPQPSAIATAWPDRREYTVRELLEALVLHGDTTAQDVLMKRIGGPGAVSAWLTAKEVPEIRVDRYARELRSDANGMPSFRSAWRAEAAFVAARDAVPAIARLAALRAYMADPRDAATPRGMIELLQKLDRGALVSQASTRMLLALMGRGTLGAGRLKAGLPAGAFLADLSGGDAYDLNLNPAHNDVGVFTLADKRSYAAAVFLSGSTLNPPARDALIARVAGAMVHAVG